jgi:hypothetical protein
MLPEQHTWVAGLELCHEGIIFQLAGGHAHVPDAVLVVLGQAWNVRFALLPRAGLHVHLEVTQAVDGVGARKLVDKSGLDALVAVGDDGDFGPGNYCRMDTASAGDAGTQKFMVGWVYDLEVR